MNGISDDVAAPNQSLKGIRVLDFTWNVAGPTCTRILAALGAEVIKVESHTMPDPIRRSPAAAGFFANLNLGKRSFTVDAKSREGHELLEQLVAESDVVVESFASGVLASWGFSYDKLVALSPNVIYVSVTGFGHTGPYQSYVTYGPTAQAYSGMTHSSGKPGRPPAGWGYSYLDVFTGSMAAAWTLSAIHKVRFRGGGPQRVDVSQVETGLSMLGELMLDAQLNGADHRRPGFPPGNRAVWPGDNTTGGARGEVGAPYGIYRTAGKPEDAFCAIAVLSDEEWIRLRACMGDPEWAMSPALDSTTGRIAAQEQLDRRVGEWTIGIDKYELMSLLTAAGVRSGPVQSGRERMDVDPSLAARAVFPKMSLADIGEHRFESIPIRIDGKRIASPPTWPVMGADTADILRDLLGLPETEIARLAAQGITDRPATGRSTRAVKARPRNLAAIQETS
ncbi:MAG: frc 9 [Frankiales bacterium]|nr:frc 9 [Frankiales bacterium]